MAPRSTALAGAQLAARQLNCVARDKTSTHRDRPHRLWLSKKCDPHK